MNTGSRLAAMRAASAGSNQPVTSRVTRSGTGSPGSSDLVHGPAAMIAAPASSVPRVGDDADRAGARLDGVDGLAAAQLRAGRRRQRDLGFERRLHLDESAIRLDHGESFRRHA